MPMGRRGQNTVPKGLVEAMRSQDSLLANEFDPSQILFVRGQSVSAADIRAHVADIFATFAAVTDIDIERKRRLLARTARIPEAVEFVAEVKAAMTAHLGRRHPALDAPGLRPHGGKRKLTGEEEVKRKAKKAETMKMRGHLTKAQKKERTFRGTVTVVATKKPR